MADTRKTLLLRVAQELWAELNRWARDDLRSVNAQIEWILRDAVRRRTRARADTAAPAAAPAWQIFASALALAAELRQRGQTGSAERLETALRAESTAQEVVDRLRDAAAQLVAEEAQSAEITARARDLIAQLAAPAGDQRRAD